jgi:dTDP-4-dehydrorhamnose reductase
MKILVTGAAGTLSAEIIPELLRQNHEVIQTDINQRLNGILKLDVTNLKAVQRIVKQERPGYIFHLAAETDVDLCEKNSKHAFSVNALGTENIALVCQECNISLLYISTGAVFSGDKLEPYTEFDIPKPINVYGRSKLQGEAIVRDILKRYFIIRAGWMIGGWHLDKKFVYKIIQKLKEGKKELMAVTDKFGSPTFTKDFTAKLMNVINTKRYGLYHLVNSGTCSRFDMAVKIVEFMGLKEKVRVNPIDSAHFPLPAPRPRSEMLYSSKLEALGLNDMPHWEKSLREYIKLNKDR